MHTSQSEIQESIYESRTHPLVIQDSRKGNPRALVNENEKPFIHYYEENIKLKKKQDDMAREMMSLKKRLNEQDQAKKRNREEELRLLAAGKKSLWDTKNRTMYTSHKNQRMPSGQKADSHKVQNLLEIIDHYKAKLITAEEQVQNLKRQKHLLEQDGKVKQKKADQLMKTFQEASGRKDSSQNLQEQLRSAINNLQIEKNRNKYNEAEIKRLETRIRGLSINQSEMEDLRAMNRNLQDKLLRLTSLPSFGAVTEKADQEHKIKELERKYKGVSEKYNQLRTDSLKVEAQVKLLKNKLIEANSEADQLEKLNQKLKKQSIDNPILSKLATNPQLLAKVVYEIEYSGKRESSSLTSQLKRQSYERILLEKEMLAKELITMRAQMDAMRENWKEKQRMIKIEKDQLLHVYKDQQSNLAKTEGGRTISKTGVPYSEDVSMFSQDTGSVPANCNYFDVFLGDLHLLETMMKTCFNIHNAETCLVMGTIDFYNHNTENTKPVHGAHANLQSQFSFKVTQDQFFFKYLNKGQFYIDVWGSQGNKRHHFGRAVVDLRPIVIKSRKNVAPVVSSSAPIYLNQRVMGSINIVMRMRLPIYDQLQKVSEISQTISGEEQAPTRRLIIQIQEGKGFNEKSNTFVYYPFRMEDYYTKTYRGANPVWNHHKSLQLKYNTDLKNYLRKNQLQLIVLDDGVVNVGEEGSDLVGNAYVSLLPLLENKIIKERVQVVRGAQKVGFIDVKIFWHDLEDPSKQKPVSAKELDSKEAELQQIQDGINKFMLENRAEPEDIFRMIDSNRSGMIAFNQFQSWVSKISPTAQLAAINQFYNSFKQPVNALNFASRLNQKQDVKSEIAMQLGMINKLMIHNTNLIQPKQSLKQFLKGKDIIEVSLDIDKSRNGRISKAELQEYFDHNNIEEDVKWHTEQIDIITFLKKYQHYT